MSNKKDYTWIFIIAGFSSLGLLVGSIAGLSSAELTVPLFGFLFAFVGGSLIAFFGKIPKESIIFSSIALTSFSLAVIFSLYIGLYIKVNEILFTNSDKVKTEEQGQNNINSDKENLQSDYRILFRSGKNRELVEYLTEEIQNGNISLTEACERLLESQQK